MDFSILSKYHNNFINIEEIYNNLTKELHLQRIDNGFFFKEKSFFIQKEKIDSLFPFSGILDTMGKCISFQPEEVLFLDLETIGLNFETSNFPFLMGIGYFEKDHFYLKQFLLLDASLEKEQLKHIEELLKQYKYIATYNGKRFDLPLLKSRFLLHSKKWEIELHHFDIYVLWKRILPKNFAGGYSQKNLENKILNFYRNDDIDSNRVPEIFYDWQKYKKYDEFYKIILHNEWDIYNLFLLFIEALRIIKNKDNQINTKIQIAKIFYKNSLYKETISLLENYIPKNEEEMLEKYSILFKSYYKLNNFHNTIVYLKKLIEIRKRPKEILFLIRLLQNQMKDYKQAIEYIDLLIDLINSFSISTKNPYLQIESLKKRKYKLLAKI